jgi:hypothetical protein
LREGYFDLVKLDWIDAVYKCVLSATVDRKWPGRLCRSAVRDDFVVVDNPNRHIHQTQVKEIMVLNGTKCHYMVSTTPISSKARMLNGLGVEHNS